LFNFFCEANRLQIYAQLIGFANFFVKYFFSNENARRFEAVDCCYSITANGPHQAFSENKNGQNERKFDFSSNRLGEFLRNISWMI